jgi:hypothetical protein
MDTTRFDRLTREFAATRSRRGVLKLLAGAVGALGVTTLAGSSSLAQTCQNEGGDCSVHADCCGSLGCLDNTCAGVQAGCADPGEFCDSNDACCQGFYCNFDSVCAAAPECAGDGEGCDADEACCGRQTCDETNRTCGGPTAGPDCAEDRDCATEELCCDGTCSVSECCTANEDPNARCADGTACFEGSCDATDDTITVPSTGSGSGTDDTITLPSTGSGSGTDDSGRAGWLLGAAAIGGVAAAVIRRQPSDRTTS